MNDIEKIKFEQLNEGYVKILAKIKGKDKEIEIGSIFSKSESGIGLDSYSGKNSIQVCGFDNMEGLWSCGRYQHSMDCCLCWNDVKFWLKNKEVKKNG